jgi:hypothetical protein
MKRQFLFVVLVLTLFSFVLEMSASAASYKLEMVAAPPEGLSAALKGALQSQGSRILNEQGSAWCELWIRKEIANIGKPASPDAKYPAFHLGSMLGVMSFPSTGSDYRGQAIKPGIYTMRYCLILQDGNHMGAAPILDFVLLIPIAEDTKDPDTALTLEELVNLSRKASGTNHPAVINLGRPPAAVSAPTLEKDDLDHWVLKTKTQSKPAAELPIGIVVVGRAEG